MMRAVVSVILEAFGFVFIVLAVVGVLVGVESVIDAIRHGL